MTRKDDDTPAGMTEGQEAGAVRSELRERMAKAAARSGDFVRQQAQTVDTRVRQQPWPLMAAALVAGILVGYIIGRRR